jgi:exonuclease III
MAVNNTNITLCSYNCGGMNRGGDFMSQLLTDHSSDLVLLQETWLLESNLLELGRLHKDYLFHGKSGVDSSSTILAGRPYGGVAILWNKCLSNRVVPFTICNRRLCAVKVILDNDVKLLLINVYMPCDNRSKTVVHEDYQKVIDDIEQVLLSSEYDCVMIFGDLNTCLNRNNAHTKLLLQFAKQNELYNVWDHPNAEPDDTYVNYALNQSSRIDHAYVTQNLVPCIVKFNAYQSPLNPSDHVPIFLDVSTMVDRIAVDQSPDNTNNISWNRVKDYHIERYKDELDQLLNHNDFKTGCISCNDLRCNDISHMENIDILCEKLIVSCLQAGNKCFPKCKSKGKVIPSWSETIEPLRDTSLFWHSLWISNGRPKSGPVAEVMRSTRAKYHKAIKDAKQHDTELRRIRFAQSHETRDSTQFWSEVKKITSTNKVVATSIDGKSDQKEICNLFYEKYSELYESVPSSQDELLSIRNEVNGRINNTFVHRVVVNELKHDIARLNSQKNGGLECSSSDHFIHASHKFVVLFSLLFQSMLNHGYMPEILLSSVIVSIPKNAKGNLSDLNNYRGIALSCALGKIIDSWIMSKCNSSLKSSDNQFAFKTNHSTSMCTLTLKETIKYFRNKESNVYVCLLDSSKAFDRLKFSCLFNLLLKRNVPPIIIRFICDSYCRQKLHVKWNGIISDNISVQNGVKQGNVLSPILFNVYMDELLSRLKQKPFGCHIDSLYVGAICYADDLTLVSPSIQGLQEMIHICEQFGLEYGVKFNDTKSKAMMFGDNSSVTRQITICGKTLEWVKEALHLGNVLSVESNDLADISNKKCKFYQSVNHLFAKFGSLQSEILCNLFNTYCTSYYGSQTWDLESSYIDSLFVAWNKASRRVWRLPTRCHTNLLPYIMGQLYITDQLISRFTKLYHTMRDNGNKLTSYFARRGTQYANTHIGHNILFVYERHKVWLNKMDNHALNIILHNSTFCCNDKTVLHQTGHLIRELCNTRDGLNNDIYLNSNELTELIEELATG